MAHDRKKPARNSGPSLKRRTLLAGILAAGMAYAAPAVFPINEAHAGDGSKNSRDRNSRDRKSRSSRDSRNSRNSRRSRSSKASRDSRNSRR